MVSMKWIHRKLLSLATSYPLRIVTNDYLWQNNFCTFIRLLQLKTKYGTDTLFWNLSAVARQKDGGAMGCGKKHSFCIDFFWVLFCVKTKKYQTKRGTQTKMEGQISYRLLILCHSLKLKIIFLWGFRQYLYFVVYNTINRNFYETNHYNFHPIL